MPESAPTQVDAVAGGDLVVLFEDDDVLVLDKGPGLVMHPGHGTGDDTLVHLRCITRAASSVVWEAYAGPGGAPAGQGHHGRAGARKKRPRVPGVDAPVRRARRGQGISRAGARRPALRSGIIREPIGRNPTVR